MQSNRILDYLYYGYIPKKNSLINFTLPSDKTSNIYHYTESEVAKIFDFVIDDLLDGCDTVIVPISGGWDSRILLGATLERFDRHQIKTVTFGTPGQFDFDIGCQIAKKFELDHHVVDLSKIELHWDNLLVSVKESPWTYVPDGYFNRLSINKVTQSSKEVVLSGYMGDPLTGGHISNVTSLDKAVDEFIRKEQKEKNLWLSETSYNPKASICDISNYDGIGYSELLDFGIRQSNCIAPIVTPQNRWLGWGGDMGCFQTSGARVLAPFAHPKWVAYWLNVPNELKRGQKLYLQMMKHKFPQLAAIPSKTTWGCKPDQHLLQWFAYFQFGVRRLLYKNFPYLPVRSGVNDNYMDFGMAFRKRTDYQTVLEIALEYLKSNNIVPWLNLDQIKKLHMSYRANNEIALFILIGLALNLNAEVNLSEHQGNE